MIGFIAINQRAYKVYLSKKDEVGKPLFPPLPEAEVYLKTQTIINQSPQVYGFEQSRWSLKNLLFVCGPPLR